MRSKIACKLRTALTVSVFGCMGYGIAMAAVVRSPGSDGMDHWYGRAGGLAGSDMVSEPSDWQRPGHAVAIGMPANSGSLYFNEGQGGFASEARVRSNESGVTVGLPANSGSLYFNEGQGGILSKPHLRPDASESAQPAAAMKSETGSGTEH